MERSTLSHEDPTPHLVQELQDLTIKLRKRRSWMKHQIVVHFLILLLVPLLLSRVGCDMGQSAGQFVYGLLLLVSSLSARHRKLLRRVSALKDPRFCGLLVEARMAASGSLRTAIDKCLAQSLPLVQEEADGAFDAHQRHLLYELPKSLKSDLMNQTANANFALTCVRCIQVTGGSETIPYLRTMKLTFASSANGAWRRVAEAAQAALPDVRIRTRFDEACAKHLRVQL